MFYRFKYYVRQLTTRVEIGSLVNWKVIKILMLALQSRFLSREITIATRVVEKLGNCYLFHAYKKGPNPQGGGGRGLLLMRIGGDSNLSPPQNWAAVMTSRSILPQVLNGTAEIWFCLPLYTESNSDSSLLSS